MNKAAIAVMLSKQIIKLIKQDRNNQYVLLERWELPPWHEELPPYDDGILEINGHNIAFNPFGPDECDGASFAPDIVGELEVVIASLQHDVCYRRVNKVHRAWKAYGWTKKRIRRLFDHVFYSILHRLAVEQTKDPEFYIRIAKTYHAGPYRFGGLFKVFNP